ncbi:hypothetical protein VTO42DRAFT_5450 [Malbranchea cinnamomea]
MNPHQQNKIDIKSLSPDEQRLLRMYGKIPNKKDLLQNKLKERKYFDSGDYALSKAGKASDVGVTSIGSRHPVPENIPHLTATSPPQGNHFSPHGSPGHSSTSHNPFAPSISRSPVKESSFLRRSSSEGKESLAQEQESQKPEAEGVSSPPTREGLPIRR